MSYAFEAYPKIPRLGKLRWSITEKLDGTNAIVRIVRVPLDVDSGVLALASGALALGPEYAVFAGSRSRWLQPGKNTDNFGFAQFVQDNIDYLVKWLGEGTHYGEWWGQGIQRTYGLSQKYFTLFNPFRYQHLPTACDQISTNALLGTVPLLYSGDGLDDLSQSIEMSKVQMYSFGSKACTFDRPEGFIVCLGDKLNKMIVHDGPKDGSRG